MTELEKQTFDKANALIEKNKQIEEMAKIIARRSTAFRNPREYLKEN